MQWQEPIPNHRVSAATRKQFKPDYGALHYQMYGETPLHAVIQKPTMLESHEKAGWYYISFTAGGYMGTLELVNTNRGAVEQIAHEAETHGITIYAREDLKYWTNTGEWVVPFRLEKRLEGANQPFKTTEPTDQDFARLAAAKERRLKRCQKHQSMIRK